VCLVVKARPEKHDDEFREGGAIGDVGNAAKRACAEEALVETGTEESHGLGGAPRGDDIGHAVVPGRPARERRECFVEELASLEILFRRW
jgi:hypothetical protein